MRYNRPTLRRLLAGMAPDAQLTADNIVTGIAMDSRRVSPGQLFIALAQDPKQRARHIEEAIASGCQALATEAAQPLTDMERDLCIQHGIITVEVAELAMKTGEIAARFYGHPSREMTVIAVTGTNGKTSVTQYIAQGLELMGIPCGVIGTLGAGRLHALTDTGMTTPDPVSVQQWLATMYQDGSRYVALEASSHALSQGRLNGVNINIAVMTNLTRDHLDYHVDLTHYAKVKSRLFDFDSVQTAILNKSDPFGQSLMTKLAENSKIEILSYSLSGQEDANLTACNLQMKQTGVSFDVHWNEKSASIQTQLLGAFNVSNVLAAMGALIAAGQSFEAVCQACVQCQPVSGRMEWITSEYNGVQVVIDYAHTPDALKQVLQAVRAHICEQGEIWCVFGCGGERDHGKRPLMGAVAEQYADHVVVTDDNPRGEDSLSIIEEIVKGIEHQEQVQIVPDRKQAIMDALSQARPGDIVLIAGKGHEAYQDIKGVKYPFHDRDVVQEWLAARGTVSR